MRWNVRGPELLVADYPAAKAFYRDIFGFRLRFERAEDRFGYFELEGAQLMLQEPGAVACGAQLEKRAGPGQPITDTSEESSTCRQPLPG